jgi:hypothetical protein
LGEQHHATNGNTKEVRMIVSDAGFAVAGIGDLKVAKSQDK